VPNYGGLGDLFEGVQPLEKKPKEVLGSYGLGVANTRYPVSATSGWANRVSGIQASGQSTRQVLLGGGLKKREKILPVMRPYSVKRVAVFGSVVRGEDSPGSDLDMLVALKGLVLSSLCRVVRHQAK